MARKKLKFNNPLMAAGTKVGAGIGTNYGMAFAVKQVPFLSKNPWLAPTTIFVATLFGLAATKPGTFINNAMDGANIISGVDTVNSVIDIAKSQAAAKAAIAEGATVDSMGRTVYPKTNGRRMGKSKNPSVKYQNYAR